MRDGYSWFTKTLCPKDSLQGPDVPQQKNEKKGKRALSQRSAPTSDLDPTSPTEARKLNPRSSSDPSVSGFNPHPDPFGEGEMSVSEGTARVGDPRLSELWSSGSATFSCNLP